MRLGKILGLWRRVSNITVRDLADDIDISAATLSRIENGKNMDGAMLAKVLTWLMAPGERKRVS